MRIVTRRPKEKHAKSAIGFALSACFHMEGYGGGQRMLKGQRVAKASVVSP